MSSCSIVHFSGTTLEFARQKLLARISASSEQTSPIQLEVDGGAASTLAALFPNLSRQSVHRPVEEDTTVMIPAAKELDKYLWLAKKYVNSNPLPFWVQHKDELKNLSKIAFELLSIPASTAAIERGFSAAGLVIAGQRHSLSARNLENEVMIKSNLVLLKKYSGIV